MAIKCKFHRLEPCQEKAVCPHWKRQALVSGPAQGMAADGQTEALSCDEPSRLTPKHPQGTDVSFLMEDTRTVASMSTRKGTWLPAFPRPHSRSFYTLNSHSGAVPSEVDPTTWHEAIMQHAGGSLEETHRCHLNPRSNLGQVMTLKPQCSDL